MGRFEGDIDHEFFRDRIVLVTGGTGSFGQKILGELLRGPVGEVRVFSRDEQKHFTMRGTYDDHRLKCLVGDVRDGDRVREAVRGADIVFHAASIKQVPLTEEHPYEAVRTNVEGAQRVLRACVDFGVERVVSISTDKAVHPVNVMGMTKAIQERLVISASGIGRLRAGCVRFGNVLASNGSVLPFFTGLLDRGVRVLPVTAVEMTRFMMTLDEGAEYALRTCRLLEGGEIVVPAIPAFRVVDLAKVLLAAYGGGRIEVTGTRPGEKLHETLISPEEVIRTDVRDGHFIVRQHQPRTGPEPVEVTEYRSDTARRMSREEIRSLLSYNRFIHYPAKIA
jgi:UDP-N-acetylglucosamine 4,6-dehydratase/5-epimerase